jgi:rfaE bifunctional protein nucleotidyltransferase chain/domain
MTRSKVIFTNGCFDVLHLGHISLLEFCSNLGEVVVGINSDESVRQLKGDSRPINGQEARIKVLESIRYVKRVILFDELTPHKLIKEIRPDLIVKGGDYEPHEVVGFDLAKVVIFPLIKNYSSSRIITAQALEKGEDVNITQGHI